MVLELGQRNEDVGLLVGRIDVEGRKEEPAPGNLEPAILRPLAAIAGVLEGHAVAASRLDRADVPAAAGQHFFRRLGRVLAFQHDHPPRPGVVQRGAQAASKLGWI